VRLPARTGSLSLNSSCERNHASQQHGCHDGKQEGIVTKHGFDSQDQSKINHSDQQQDLYKLTHAVFIEGKSPKGAFEYVTGSAPCSYCTNPVFTGRHVKDYHAHYLC